MRKNCPFSERAVFLYGKDSLEILTFAQAACNEWEMMLKYCQNNDGEGEDFCERKVEICGK